ncbi:hypothetical protein D3C87_1766130 [compost metagenome]
MGGDDDDALAVIFPVARIAGNPLIGGAAHDDGADGLDEGPVVMFAEIEIGLLGEPIEILVAGSDEAVEAGGNIADYSGHGCAPAA